MLERNDVILIVIDMQERMLPVITDGDRVTTEVARLIRGARALDLPVIVTEQYPQGLGTTIEPVRAALGELYEPIEKMSFSACGDLHFMQHLEAANCQHVLLCGVEAHVCVYQTASDLIQLGWEVQLVTDAIGSRRESNMKLAQKKLAHHGVDLTSVEMALFELMVRADIPEFKSVSQIVK